MRRGPRTRYLLLLANVFILLVPLFGLLFLRLWDSHLIRVTEEQLIGESEVLAAAWRTRAAAGRLPEPHAPPDAMLNRLSEILPAAPLTRRVGPASADVLTGAAAGLESLLEQAAARRGAAAALLDAQGCAVAAVGIPRDACLGSRAEVRHGLSVGYAAVARQPDDGGKGWHGLGAVQVETVLPVRAGDAVGAVWLSRRSSSPFQAMWDHRGTVLFGTAACALFMIAVTLFFSRVISRPLGAITAVAEAIARGDPPQPFAPRGVVPSEVAALSDALDHMTAQLTARTRYIADFAATASHELKTPIAGIRGAVELLRDAWEEMPAEQRQRFLANVDADAARMQGVVSRLLQLARIEHDAEATTPVDVAPFFDALARRYEGRVRLALHDAPAAIAINPDHLEQAVGNLLDNALRHGAGQPVDLTVGARGRRLAVEVRDHGAGISPGNQPRIFERFFTTERDRGGTGLGLAIVRAIAEARGGEVRFATGPTGTTFTLTV